MPHLRYTDDTGTRRELLLGADHPVVSIGRRRGSDIATANKTVARSHSQLLRLGAARELTDLGSPNGTRANGKPLARAPRARRRHPLRQLRAAVSGPDRHSMTKHEAVDRRAAALVRRPDPR